MSNFWGDTKADGHFEDTGFEPIPANTALKCNIVAAAWTEYQGDRYIEIDWLVVDGEYKNRHIFQKLKVLDSKENTASRAKRMLAAIDFNAGGKLLASGAMPDDGSLAQNLINHIMWIKVGIWNFEGKTGNYVTGVSAGAKPSMPTPAATQTDDMPF